MTEKQNILYDFAMEWEFETGTDVLKSFIYKYPKFEKDLREYARKLIREHVRR